MAKKKSGLTALLDNPINLPLIAKPFKKISLKSSNKSIEDDEISDETETDSEQDRLLYGSKQEDITPKMAI
jgi:hypothetical protein